LEAQNLNWPFSRPTQSCHYYDTALISSVFIPHVPSMGIGNQEVSGGAAFSSSSSDTLSQTRHKTAIPLLTVVAHPLSHSSMANFAIEPSSPISWSTLLAMQTESRGLSSTCQATSSTTTRSTSSQSTLMGCISHRITTSSSIRSETSLWKTTIFYRTLLICSLFEYDFFS
jgi:hypothetical protein